MDMKPGLLYGVTRRLAAGAECKYAIRALEIGDLTVTGVNGQGLVVEVERTQIESWIPDAPLLRSWYRDQLDSAGTSWVHYGNVPTWDCEVRISKNGRRAVVLSQPGLHYERAGDTFSAPIRAAGRRRSADLFYEVPVAYAVSLIVAAGTHDHEIDPAHVRSPRVQRALAAKSPEPSIGV
jgi:hypothetical protein